MNPPFDPRRRYGQRANRDPQSLRPPKNPSPFPHVPGPRGRVRVCERSRKVGQLVSREVDGESSVVSREEPSSFPRHPLSEATPPEPKAAPPERSGTP